MGHTLLLQQQQQETMSAAAMLETEQCRDISFGDVDSNQCHSVLHVLITLSLLCRPIAGGERRAHMWATASP